MIGEHRLTLHETNTQAFVPVCSCGFIGLAHVHPDPLHYEDVASGDVRARRIASALAEHDAHTVRCARPLVDRMNP